MHAQEEYINWVLVGISIVKGYHLHPSVAVSVACVNEK